METVFQALVRVGKSFNSHVRDVLDVLGIPPGEAVSLLGSRGLSVDMTVADLLGALGLYDVSPVGDVMGVLRGEAPSPWITPDSTPSIADFLRQNLSDINKPILQLLKYFNISPTVAVPALQQRGIDPNVMTGAGLLVHLGLPEDATINDVLAKFQ